MTSDTLQINGQTFHTVRLAARSVSYSKDYITRLARERKIRAVAIGRSWYVDQDSLAQYTQLQTLEAEARRRQLSYNRQVELQLHEKINPAFITITPSSFRFVVYPLLVALLIISVGFLSGTQLSQIAQVASVAQFDTPTPIQTVAAGSDVIQPVFSDQPSVVVEDARVVTPPDTEHNWLRIRYD